MQSGHGTVTGLPAIFRSHIEAQQLAKLVKVTYDKLPAIFTIDEAIQAKSFIAPWAEGHYLERGDVDAVFASAAAAAAASSSAASASVAAAGSDAGSASSPAVLTLEGEARIGGQEHFYLESMQCIATPGEGDALHISGTTQNLRATQEYIAHVLGIGAHHVVCSVKRMGGAFGGKETRSLALFAATALVARKCGRTVRLLLDRDTDMSVTGQRHAFVGRYKVAFTPAGRIVGADVKLYANAGCSADLSMPVVDRALFHVDNCYDMGAVRFRGWPCKTNLPSNTAFRGFGGPQGMFVGEHMIDAVAQRLGLKTEDVRRVNLYQQGDVTPYGQTLREYSVPAQWAHVEKAVDLEAKRREIAEFNARNLYRKRGMAIVPTKFGISFTAKFLNQAGALVLVYSDGTVLISHGGTEVSRPAAVRVHASSLTLSERA